MLEKNADTTSVLSKCANLNRLVRELRRLNQRHPLEHPIPARFGDAERLVMAAESLVAKRETIATSRRASLPECGEEPSPGGP